ncbi:MAG: hypothetical protein KA376_05955, partial [Alistipes sp.]|nr:hypothetical protein [Alistipes sp.]
MELVVYRKLPEIKLRKIFRKIKLLREKNIDTLPEKRSVSALEPILMFQSVCRKESTSDLVQFQPSHAFGVDLVHEC